MKIVDLMTFLTMPAGTLFSKYQPCVFDNFCIKGDNIGEMDFGYQDLVGAVDGKYEGEVAFLLEDSQYNGTSVPLDFDCGSRDGCFDEKQLFAVWELKDLEQLIARLLEARCDMLKKEAV